MKKRKEKGNDRRRDIQVVVSTSSILYSLFIYFPYGPSILPLILNIAFLNLCLWPSYLINMCCSIFTFKPSWLTCKVPPPIYILPFLFNSNLFFSFSILKSLSSLPISNTYLCSKRLK